MKRPREESATAEQGIQSREYSECSPECSASVGSGFVAVAKLSWASMGVEEIPSKTVLHHSFVARLEPPPAYERHNTARIADDAAWARGDAVPASRCVLDMGCGDGRIAIQLALQSPDLQVHGVDLNPAAVRQAQELAREAGVQDRMHFEVADLTQEQPPPPQQQFDIVLMQLLLSIIGGPAERAAVLTTARARLRPGGILLLSAGAVSSDINAENAELYQRDEAETGEKHTYYSRSASGEVLYPTHHFQYQELLVLLKCHGFEVVELHKDREVSSRRPDQLAWFLFGVALCLA